jgi:hypothetical protein
MKAIYFKTIDNHLRKNKSHRNNMRWFQYSFSIVAFTVLWSLCARAQEATPQLLKEPANWTFERFALPPVFAPNFPYKGAEELRFSPGMFNKSATDYFTYAFVAQLDSVTSISQDEIRNYLLNYFKGLCSSTAHDRKLVIDTSAITVNVKKKNNTPGNTDIYNVSLNIFGVFADGAPVKLNMEVKALKDAETTKVYLVFIASPHGKADEVWKELYKIQENFVVPRVTK